MKLKHFSYVCLVLSIGNATVVRGDSFDQLLPKVPPSANVLVLIDVERTLASPLAQADGWGKKLELAYVSRPIFLPPEATKLVMAASLEPGNNFQRHWELAVMQLSDPMSMRSIARSEGGYVDTVNGVVYLIGIAHDRKELERATNHARAVPYVRKVVSHVRLMTAPLG